MNWNDYFMNIAHAVKLRSKDPKTKVGTVIVDRWNRIAGTGYNGLPAGSSHDTNSVWETDEKHRFVTHSEENALNYIHHSVMDSGDDLKLYTTHYPCINCAKLICNSRIHIVYYQNLKFFSREAEELFKQHGVETVCIHPKEISDAKTVP